VSNSRQAKAACCWGLALGCGSGILLAGQWVRSTGFGLGLEEVVGGFLVGLAAGSVLGVVAGLAVWATGTAPGPTFKRLALTRGLKAAAACVIVAVLGAATYGGLFGARSAYWGNNPGWETAVLAAVIWAICRGPVIAAAGFVLGIAIALILHDGEPA
jgi:hypothetical protein